MIVVGTASRAAPAREACQPVSPRNWLAVSGRLRRLRVAIRFGSPDLPRQGGDFEWW